MNKIHKIALTFVLCILTFSAVQAQRGGGRNMNPAKMAERQTTMLTDSLALSEAQQQKVAEVNLLYANKMAEARTKARENQGADRASIRSTMQALRSEQKAELKKYLTSEQFEKMEAIETNRQAKRGDRKGKRGGKKKKADQSLEIN